MLVRGVAIVLLLSGLPLSAQDLQHSLKNEYVNKIFLIRGFYQDQFLHFSSDGTLENSGHVGSWTTAGIHIQNVKVRPDHLEITGERIAQVTQNSVFVPMRTHSNLAIQIDEPTLDEQAVRGSLERVFIDQKIPIADIVPEYWRGALRPDRDRKVFGPLTEAEKKEPCTTPSVASPCRVGGDVKPPRPASTPDPTYDELAKQNKYQGTTVLWLVVDESGKPQRIQIVRPIGFGLDDQAVETVSNWKFQPATRDGNPVPVQINVEVNFRLH